MYVLHIANKNYSSWSLRPWVLLTTLGIPFEERQHFFPSDGPSYPEFSKFSPTGFVPVLDDGDIKVWDSLAIALHVAETHPEVASVLVTHHLEELPSSTTHAVLLADGRVVAAGPAMEALTSGHVSAAFDHPIDVGFDDGRWTARAARRVAVR